MIAIVDYDMGNVASVLNMLKRIGAGDAVLTRDPGQLREASRVILPGVGAFDQGMKNLAAFGLLDALNDAALTRRVPVLGICLGMQLLSSSSEEGRLTGLGWLDSQTVRFESGAESLKIPHMGWSSVNVRRISPIIDQGSETRYYFVHAYHVMCKDADDVVATASYGIDFPAIVNRDNIFGVQFHPEKSHRFGMELLKRFVEL